VVFLVIYHASKIDISDTHMETLHPSKRVAELKRPDAIFGKTLRLVQAMAPWTPVSFRCKTPHAFPGGILRQSNTERNDLSVDPGSLLNDLLERNASIVVSLPFYSTFDEKIVYSTVTADYLAYPIDFKRLDSPDHPVSMVCPTDRARKQSPVVINSKVNPQNTPHRARVFETGSPGIFLAVQWILPRHPRDALCANSWVYEATGLLLLGDVVFHLVEVSREHMPSFLKNCLCSYDADRTGVFKTGESRVLPWTECLFWDAAALLKIACARAEDAVRTAYHRDGFSNNLEECLALLQTAATIQADSIRFHLETARTQTRRRRLHPPDTDHEAELFREVMESRDFHTCKRDCLNQT